MLYFDIYLFFLFIEINGFGYILLLILDEIWIFDKEYNFLLVNIVGEVLYYVDDFCEISFLC